MNGWPITTGFLGRAKICCVQIKSGTRSLDLLDRSSLPLNPSIAIHPAPVLKSPFKRSTLKNSLGLWKFTCLPISSLCIRWNLLPHSRSVARLPISQRVPHVRIRLRKVLLLTLKSRPSLVLWPFLALRSEIRQDNLPAKPAVESLLTASRFGITINLYTRRSDTLATSRDVGIFRPGRPTLGGIKELSMSDEFGTG